MTISVRGVIFGSRLPRYGVNFARRFTVWAALSAAGMAGLRLPDGIPHKLTIAPDGDTAGREAAHKLAERASALGWSVSLLPAPDGRDWNDILMLKGAMS